MVLNSDLPYSNLVIFISEDQVVEVTFFVRSGFAIAYVVYLLMVGIIASTSILKAVIVNQRLSSKGTVLV